jgi:ABC-type branched-subunit amino acid transport system substrate-binding protein
MFQGSSRWKRPRLRPRAIIASAAASALALTGLSAALTSGASATVKHSNTPLTIGFVVPESGAFAPYSNGSLQFFNAWISYTNAHGGVAGHKVKVITLDDKSDPGQILIDYEQLWSQDHVLAIADGFGQGAPLSYIQSNQIPTFSGGFSTQAFSKHYTSMFTTGGQLPAWSAQTAYWIVKIMHRPIKRVAVMYNNGFDAGFLGFIQNYWKKLGATFIDTVPDEGPTADCSAYILKFKSEGVQYIDEQALQNGNCILAEARLGWKPPLGQGGPVTSEIGEAELIGKPYVGVVAGSPNTLYTGAPIHSQPTAEDRTFVGNIRKYAPSYANYNYLNGTGIVQTYGIGVLLTTVMSGVLSKYGKVTPALINSYTRNLTNFDDGLQPIVPSFQPNCKTGGDATIWGFWHWNDHPTAAKPQLYMVPTSGPNWVTNAFLGVSKCYLTQAATKLFPTG